MFQLPVTTTGADIIHSHTTGPELEIIIPQRPDQYLAMVRTMVSFHEKPWPIGRYCLFVILPDGTEFPQPVNEVFLTRSGLHYVDSSTVPLYFPIKGAGARIVISGGGEKHAVIQIL